MKNIFAVNIEHQNGPIRMDGDCFTTNRIDIVHQQQLEQTSQEFDSQVQTNAIPNWLRIIVTISFFLGLIIATSILGALPEVSLQMAYHNAGWLFYVAGFGLVAGPILWMIERKRQKAFLKTKEFKILEEQIVTSIEESKTQLQIPEESLKIDVFGYSYVNRNGKIKYKTSLFYRYLNVEWNAYLQKDCLCFADLHQVLSIPIASIVAIHQINKRVSFSGWNKEDAYQKDPYKTFKYGVDDFGTMYVKPHYAVQIRDAFGEFEFLIPPHELATIRAWTGLEPTLRKTTN